MLSSKHILVSFLLFSISTITQETGAAVVKRQTNVTQRDSTPDTVGLPPNKEKEPPKENKDENANEESNAASKVKGHLSTSNKSDCATNDTQCNSANILGKWRKNVEKNRDMLMRTFYVLLGVTAAVVLYFVIRAVRLRKSNKTRKYGLLPTRSDKLEMTPLDQDFDDEDDITVYDRHGNKR